MATRSPILHERPGSEMSDAPIGPAELTGLIVLAYTRGARSIAIGSGRDSRSLDSARAVAETWKSIGGEIALELDWPEDAASWLRQARRFAAVEADLWIMLGPPLGWVQMTRRLLWSTTWMPTHTLLSGDLSDRRVLELVGLGDLAGIAGVTREGDPWHLAPDNQIIIEART